MLRWSMLANEGMNVMPPPMLASQGHCDSDSSVERWPYELDPVLPGGRRERVGLLGSARQPGSGRCARPLGRAADARARRARRRPPRAITSQRAPSRYLLLNHRLARRIVEAHGDWLDEVERELG